jgi:hypothetical protein
MVRADLRPDLLTEVSMQMYSVDINLINSAGEVSVAFYFSDQTRTLFFPAPRGRLLLEEIARTCLLDWVHAHDDHPTRTIKAV